MIYIFYGTGGGKTLAALGLALRARGQNHRVAIIQFMKNFKDTGEFKIAKKIGYKIFQFGRPELIDINCPEPEDYNLALRGLEKAKEELKKKPHLLVLDELCLACAIGLLKEKEVLSFLKKVPKSTDVALTGRFAPESFLRIADGVSEIVKIKHVFDKGVKAKKGIEY